jgi:DNA-binding NarL/FixJ family response regulator
MGAIVGTSTIEAGAPRDLTIIVVDDHQLTRACVRQALDVPGMRVVQEAADAEEAVAACARHRPDVCVLAARIPGNAVVAAEQIRERAPATKIVMLTRSDRPEDLFAALRAGAVGYLPESMSADRLPYAIRGVAQGEAAVPRSLIAQLITEFSNRDRGQRTVIGLGGAVIELTVREAELLGHLRRGEGTAVIAHRLGISDVTVRRHISAIVRKLGVRDRRAAIQLLAQVEMGQLSGVA